MIENIRQRLSDYAPRPAEGDFKAKAAILVPLYLRDGVLHVVLTKRTDKVDSHKGEISFPGGRFDETDSDLQFTALRESLEEIGLHPDHVKILGRIDDIITVSSYHVTAFVGEIDPDVSPYTWLAQEFEVAEIIEVPLLHLLSPDSHIEVPRTRNGELIMQPAFQYGDHQVWGATYRMLRNFLDVAVLPIVESAIERGELVDQPSDTDTSPAIMGGR